jgi:hypothetical protein
MAWEPNIDESTYRRVWPTPDLEPVEWPWSSSVYANWITPADIETLLEEGP